MAYKTQPITTSKMYRASPYSGEGTPPRGRAQPGIYKPPEERRYFPENPPIKQDVTSNPEYRQRVKDLASATPRRKTQPGFYRPPERSPYPPVQRPVDPKYEQKLSELEVGGMRRAGPEVSQQVPTYEGWKATQQRHFPAVMVPDPRGTGGQVDYAFAEYLKATGQVQPVNNQMGQYQMRLLMNLLMNLFRGRR